MRRARRIVGLVDERVGVGDAIERVAKIGECRDRIGGSRCFIADDIELSAYFITDDIAYTLSPSGHVFRGAKAMAVFAKTRMHVKVGGRGGGL